MYMWGKEEFPYSVRIGDHVELKDRSNAIGGEVVDIIKTYDQTRAYAILVRTSNGYYEVKLDDVTFWEPYGENKKLDSEELMRIELYKFIKRWDIYREEVDEMLDYIYIRDNFEFEENTDYES